MKEDVQFKNNVKGENLYSSPNTITGKKSWRIR
jgi:hypothetical protein